MKQLFSTSVGPVEVLVDAQSRVVSAYRFNGEGRPVAAALESLDYTDLADLLTRQAGVPHAEAADIASVVTEELGALGEEPPIVEEPPGDLSRGPEATKPERLALAIAAFAAIFLIGVAVWLVAPAVF
jgi:hypothetical protein